MPYGMYISAEGANAQARRLEVIANNMANVDTVGFKRQLALFQARYAQDIEQGDQTPGTGSLEDVGGGITLAGTQTDFSPGPIKHTSIPTDMAIEGQGFFVVEKDGQQYLTRAGNFRLTPQGGLVTQQGYPVLGDGGAPIVLEQPSKPFSLLPNGTIVQGESRRDLALVQPASLGDLARVGENLFRPLADTTPVPAGQRRVAGGSLEMSGVQPAQEMIAMIETSRVLEANASLIQLQDQMLNGLVSRVLTTS